MIKTLETEWGPIRVNTETEEVNLDDVLKAGNLYRKEKGLKALTWDEVLDEDPERREFFEKAMLSPKGNDTCN